MELLSGVFIRLLNECRYNTAMNEILRQMFLAVGYECSAATAGDFSTRLRGFNELKNLTIPWQKLVRRCKDTPKGAPKGTPNARYLNGLEHFKESVYVLLNMEADPNTCFAVFRVFDAIVRNDQTIEDPDVRKGLQGKLSRDDLKDVEKVSKFLFNLFLFAFADSWRNVMPPEECAKCIATCAKISKNLKFLRKISDSDLDAFIRGLSWPDSTNRVRLAEPKKMKRESNSIPPQLRGEVNTEVSDEPGTGMKHIMDGDTAAQADETSQIKEIPNNDFNDVREIAQKLSPFMQKSDGPIQRHKIQRSSLGGTICIHDGWIYFMHQTCSSYTYSTFLCRARVLSGGFLDESTLECLAGRNNLQLINSSFLVKDNWVYCTGYSHKTNGFVLTRLNSLEDWIEDQPFVVGDADDDYRRNVFTVDENAVYHVERDELNKNDKLVRIEINTRKSTTIDSMDEIADVLAQGNGNIYFTARIHSNFFSLFSITEDGVARRMLAERCDEFFFADGQLYAWCGDIFGNEFDDIWTLSRWEKEGWTPISKNIRPWYHCSWSRTYVSEDLRFFWFDYENTGGLISTGYIHSDDLRGKKNKIFTSDLTVNETSGYEIRFVENGWIYYTFHSNGNRPSGYFRASIVKGFPEQYSRIYPKTQVTSLCKLTLS